MLQDLGAVAPSVIICVAFLVGVIALVKHEMGPRRKGHEGGQPHGDRQSAEP